MPSPAAEDYLKAIYKLEDDGPVATSSLADEMGVSAASATNMAKRLARMHLAEYESYRGLTLTDAGRKIALEIIRHHRLLETYLKEVMDYSWAKLHEEAEHLEHHISEEFEAKLEELLGHPTHDPHGHPIPDRDGTLVEAAVQPLAQADAGSTVVVDHLADGDPDLLHHLEDIGLMPQAEVTVAEKAPFDGPLTVRIGTAEHTVGFVVAQSVFVRPCAKADTARPAASASDEGVDAY
jgi:DtxR family Mn-dependent transcriptional regulator